MNWTTIDWVQFDTLLKQLDKTNWSPIIIGILAQFVGICVAAYSGYFFQKRFEKLDRKRKKQIESYRFNEAVMYLSIILENMASLATLVLESMNSERIQYNEILEKTERISLKKSVEPSNFKLVIIKTIEVVDAKNLISKVPDIGKYPEAIRAFYRMRSEILQATSICEDRNSLINAFLNEGPVMDINSVREANILSANFNAIFDRTKKSLISIESILDIALFLRKELGKVGATIKADNKKDRVEARIIGLELNSYIEELFIKITQIIDANPINKDRMLYRRHVKETQN